MKEVETTKQKETKNYDELVEYLKDSCRYFPRVGKFLEVVGQWGVGGGVLSANQRPVFFASANHRREQPGSRAGVSRIRSTLALTCRYVYIKYGHTYVLPARSLSRLWSPAIDLPSILLTVCHTNTMTW